MKTACTIVNYAYNTGVEWLQEYHAGLLVILSAVTLYFFLNKGTKENRQEIKENRQEIKQEIDKSEGNLRNDIEKSEKHQDELRKTELEPIKERVNNHLPTDIERNRNELQASIKESKTELQAYIKESKDDLKASIEKLEKLILDKNK